MKKDKIKGLYFTEHTDRMYPNGNFASHFIGYAQPDKKESLVGMMGLKPPMTMS